MATSVGIPLSSRLLRPKFPAHWGKRDQFETLPAGDRLVNFPTPSSSFPSLAHGRHGSSNSERIGVKWQKLDSLRLYAVENDNQRRTEDDTGEADIEALEARLEGGRRARKQGGSDESTQVSPKKKTLYIDPEKGETKTEGAPSLESSGSSMNQMLGIKGASAETNIWKIRLQLTKPVTWAPLIWGVACGAAASGNFNWGNPEDIAKAALCMFMSGPLLTGYTQTINDWYDREIDAINEPYRPIPSGAISEQEVIAQVWILLLGGIGAAYVLDLWAGHDFPIILSLAVGGSLLSYIYSAPPLKLKQSGWIGNYALGSSYISLPWWSGQALFGTLTPDILVLTLLYSTAGLGIAIINDFKSIEGDRAMGLQSLPVAFGVDTAKWICAGSIDITQLSVAAYLFSQGKTIYALILLALIAPQILFQFQYFLKDPVKYDVKYQASAQPFFVFGLLVTALATSH